MDADTDIPDLLRRSLPRECVSTDDLALYGSDVFYTSPHLPAAVVRPATEETVQALVRLAVAHHLSLAIRGAGLSYSDAYLARNARTVLVDMRGLDKVVEVNATDRYVTVQAGVTWESLAAALKDTGLRTPFWGTFSGKYATVGAALSQGAKFFGSGDRGISAESVLGMRVVTGDGDLVVTGSAATPHDPSPFWRNYGPDLTGIFLADTGAFGIKTQATLQLIPAPTEVEVASFSFDRAQEMLTAMTAIGSELLASECFALDPLSVRLRMKSEGLDEDLRLFMSVVSQQRSRLGALRDAAKLALHGRRYLDDVGFLMNVVTEGRMPGEAATKLQRARALARAQGGEEVPGSIPRIMRAQPFRKLNRLLGVEGERIAWTHTVMPNSRAVAAYEATDAIFEAHAPALRAHGISWGYLISANGPSGLGLETLTYFPGEALPIHAHYIDPEHFKRLPRQAANPEALAAVEALSVAVVEAWSGMGGVHLQIGRKYPYLRTRLPATRALVGGLKSRLDPHRIFNLGVLDE
jgi:FAD/FMN-containing dehydrogenase